MDMDNAIPPAYRVWHEAVIPYLPEDQRDKGYEYFRPGIDYDSLINSETGVLSFDLAARIEDFCRSERLGAQKYIGGDIETRGQTIIELAALCENRDKMIIDTLDRAAAEYISATPNADKEAVAAICERLKAEFDNLDKELERRVRVECLNGYSNADKQRVSADLAKYPKQLRQDTGFVALIVYRNAHREGIAHLQELNKRLHKIAENDVIPFQLLSADVQVQLELELDSFHKYAQAQISHRSKVIALYNAKIHDRQTQALASKRMAVTPAADKPSILREVRETAKTQQDRHSPKESPDKDKNKPGLE